MGDTIGIIAILCFGLFVGYQWGQTDGRVQMWKGEAVCIAMPSGAIHCEATRKKE